MPFLEIQFFIDCNSDELIFSVGPIKNQIMTDLLDMVIAIFINGFLRKNATCRALGRTQIAIS